MLDYMRKNAGSWIIKIMLFGIVELCQPLIVELYSYGFAITLTGVGGYMFVSHMK